MAAAGRDTRNARLVVCLGICNRFAGGYELARSHSGPATRLMERWAIAASRSQRASWASPWAEPDPGIPVGTLDPGGTARPTTDTQQTRPMAVRSRVTLPAARDAPVRAGRSSQRASDGALSPDELKSRVASFACPATPATPPSPPSLTAPAYQPCEHGHESIAHAPP